MSTIIFRCGDLFRKADAPTSEIARRGRGLAGGVPSRAGLAARPTGTGVGGRPEDALEALDGILAQQPDFFTAVLLRTGILAKEGRENEATEAMTDLQRINPNFRLAHAPYFFMNRDQEYVAAFTEALRKAGLPE